MQAPKILDDFFYPFNKIFECATQKMGHQSSHVSGNAY